MATNFMWAFAGLALCALELVSGTFVLLIFGVSALIVAGAATFGLEATSFQFLLFALLSILNVLMFRDKILAAIRKKSAFRADSDKIILSSGIAPNGQESIQYQGTVWTAVNNSATPLHKGDAVLVEKVDGIKLFVRKVGESRDGNQ